MSTVVITGGSGLIGTALSSQLAAKGHEVIILSRGEGRKETATVTALSGEGKVTYASWDISKQFIEPGVIEKADFIIHLAGAGVADKRWSSKRKQEIVDSRVNSGRLLVKALQETNNTVKAVISASGIGWYGPDKAAAIPFVETDPADGAFLGETCRLWEEATEAVTSMGKRKVVFRTGLVFSKEGGALTEFRKPIQFGVAAILGNGKQVVSWIHIDDLCRMFIKAIEDDSLNGIYNAVSPKPATNRNLVMELAKKMRGKFFIPVYVPSFVLKLMVGEMSIEVLKSTTVSCSKIKHAGFIFQYPTLEAALNALTGKNN